MKHTTKKNVKAKRPYSYEGLGEKKIPTEVVLLVDKGIHINNEVKWGTYLSNHNCQINALVRSTSLWRAI